MSLDLNIAAVHRELVSVGKDAWQTGRLMYDQLAVRRLSIVLPGEAFPVRKSPGRLDRHVPVLPLAFDNKMLVVSAADAFRGGDLLTRIRVPK